MQISVIEQDGKKAIKVHNENFSRIYTEYRKLDDYKSIHYFFGLFEELEKEKEKYKDMPYSKKLNKARCDLLKDNPKRFVRHFNALMFKTFIADQHDVSLVYKLCTDFKTGKSNFDLFRLTRFKEAEEKIMQCKKDGIWNIAPLVMEFNKTPSELRVMFGKGLWKKLCKNSFHRNLLIQKSTMYAKIFGNREDYAYLVENLNKVASTVLMLFHKHINTEVAIYFTNNYKGKYTNTAEYSRICHLIKDTKRMATNLGVEVDMNWTPRRMKEEHDAMVKKISAIHSSPEPLSWLVQLPDDLKHFEYKGFTADLLMSPAEIAEEGHMMHHCVGTIYKDQVIHQSYIVFSVKDEEGNRYSTLGCKHDPITKQVVFDQHYKKYNASINDDRAKELDLRIVQAFRKIYKPEKQRVVI